MGICITQTSRQNNGKKKFLVSQKSLDSVNFHTKCVCVAVESNRIFQMVELLQFNSRIRRHTHFVLHTKTFHYFIIIGMVFHGNFTRCILLCQLADTWLFLPFLAQNSECFPFVSAVALCFIHLWLHMVFIMLRKSTFNFDRSIAPTTSCIDFYFTLYFDIFVAVINFSHSTNIS